MSGQRASRRPASRACHWWRVVALRIVAGEMQCLWLTLADPDPATNGQLLYSRGLIDSVRDAGARLRVVGLRRPEKAPHGPHRDDIDWLLGEEVRRSLP